MEKKIGKSIYMKLQHLTYGGDSQYRDTAGIAPETIEHFKGFQIKTGGIPLPVEKTELEVKLTVQDDAAVFTFFKMDDGTPYVTCYSSFSKQGHDLIWPLLEREAKKDPFHKNAYLDKPDTHVWLYSYVLLPADPATAMLIGEISFYVWNAIRLAKK